MRLARIPVRLAPLGSRVHPRAAIVRNAVALARTATPCSVSTAPLTDSMARTRPIDTSRTPARRTLPTRLSWPRAQVFIGAWLGFSTYRVIQLLALTVADPGSGPSRAVRVGMGILDGALVGLSTLLLLWAGERMSVERPHRARTVAVHVTLALGCALITLSVLFAVGRVVAPDSSGEGLFVFNLASITGPLFTYLAIAAAIQAAVYQQRYLARELDALRLGTQLTEARLESLRAKLHPHFLFNTLNGISDLIFSDPRKADAVVLRLARLLRASLDTHDAEISVREELGLLAAYFEIERMRFGNRLRVTIDADVTTFDARVPPFLVQPLAENAIQHGIAPRASGGEVTVRARVMTRDRADALVLELADDGVGLPDEIRDGVGLRITRERLHAMYRGAAALSVSPREGGGTIATIELPFVPFTPGRFAAVAV
ncbi:MAG TPA: histidine kinase [Gemmatimonadaceae bacterium]|nr:histidine kinase [Gemmatimonadaceae bacterium]